MEKTLQVRLLNMANMVYPDERIGNFFHLSTGDEIPGATGDTLALFIGREIMETGHTLQGAIDALTRARREIDEVICALESKL